MTAYPIAAIVAGATAAYLTATGVGAVVAAMGFPLPPAERRAGYIDGMRGYLALSVLIHHFIVWMQVARLGGAWDYPTINIFNEIGAGSVGLFFMTTGYLFYPRVLAGIRACSWPAVYVTRFCRIVPLVAVSVAAVTILVAVRTGRRPGLDFPMAAARWLTAWEEGPLLAYPDSGRLNAYVLWSLWYEWMFYLFVLPASALAMDLIRGRLPTWTVPLALAGGAIALQFAGVPYPILQYLPVFAIGMLAYELQRREPVVRLARTRTMGVVAALCLVIGLTIAKMPYTWALPFFGLFFFCVACGNGMGGVLRTRGALVLGECSFGIYLLHGLVLSLLFVEAAPYTAPMSTAMIPLFLPAAAAVLALITPVTFLCVERPAIGFGRLIAKAWTGRRLKPDTAALNVAP